MKPPKKSKKQHKYIFVYGGVMSGVGKGITTASLCLILESRGYRVRPIKVDPYLNVDAGTMNPVEHGEVFVLDAGTETDQDMGTYERFLNRDLSADDYMTSGMIYKYVIEKERNLGFGGKTVEAIPHIRDEIISRIEAVGERAEKYDVTVVEIGGTVGDYQNMLFIEAARVIGLKHRNDVCNVLVSYLPVPGTLGEMKTRPTQHAARELNSYGVQPDFIVARASVPVDDKRKEKIAAACNVLPEAVIAAPDIKSIYDVPLNFERDHTGDLIMDHLGLAKRRSTGLAPWKKFVKGLQVDTAPLRIGVIGKYFDTGNFVLSDAYVSVIEAVRCSASYLKQKVELVWINSKDFEKDPTKLDMLKGLAGVIVPGGFGSSGIEGKIAAIRYVREHNIPFLGLCYGMQLAVIEFARHIAQMPGAHTTEIDAKTPYPVIDILPEQLRNLETKRYGGSMRLGAHDAHITKGTHAYDAYGKTVVSERHRHRYEVNPELVKALIAKGLVFSGMSPSGTLCEIAELPKQTHPFFIASQFHPELKARPLSPHPLFTAFLRASLKHLKK